MTVVINGSTGIDKVAAGAIEKSDLPAGTVLQVVNATYSTQTVSTTSTLADTGLTATITPTSSTSKILVFCSISGLDKTGNTWGKLALLRNSTTLVSMESQVVFDNTTGENCVGSSTTSYLDSPATTSAITYKVQFANGGATGNFYINITSTTASTSSITLMEIAA